MTTPDLSGKRVLLLGAETDLGAEIARALAEAGASVALVAASNDAETAFAVKRLARTVGAPGSQAIDATNEMAVRVMVRQVSRDLGGLDAAILLLSSPSARSIAAYDVAQRRLLTDFAKKGGGRIVTVNPPWSPTKWDFTVTDGGVGLAFVNSEGRLPEQVAAEVLVMLSVPSENVQSLAAPPPSE